MSSSESSQRDFGSAFQPLPEVSPEAPHWGERFLREMPTLEPPYYGVNVADVRRENYDAIFQNIEQQVQGAELLLGGRLHFFSATDYEEVRRVMFIIYFATFPDTETVLETLRGAGVAQADDTTGFPDLWTESDLWKEFTRLAEGYTWWITPALPANESP